MKVIVLCDTIARGQLWASISRFDGVPDTLWPRHAKIETRFVVVTDELPDFGSEGVDFVLIQPEASDRIEVLHGAVSPLYRQQIRNQLPIGGFLLDCRRNTLEVRSASPKPDIG